MPFLRLVSKRRLRLVLVLATLALATACDIPPPMPKATPTAVPPQPPQVASYAPKRTAEQPIDEPLQIVFDQAMDHGSVESAWHISPQVDGTLTWRDTTLVFSLTEMQNRFDISPDHHWMIVKLETHNSLRYYHVRMDGQPSEGLGRIICPPYEPFVLGEAT